jgi:hypothetical protein
MFIAYHLFVDFFEIIMKEIAFNKIVIVYHKVNTETLTDTSKEVGLEINAEKTIICCCLITRMQGKIMA